MASPLKTLKGFLQSIAGDDHVQLNGVRWRAEHLLNTLTLANDARLSEFCVEGANGVLSLYTNVSGAIGTVDSSATITAFSRTHK